MPDKALDTTTERQAVMELVEMADRNRRAVEVLFEDVDGPLMYTERETFLREMARGMIGNSIKALRLAGQLVKQQGGQLDASEAEDKAGQILPNMLYEHLFMPAKKAEFPDDKGDMEPILVRDGVELRGGGTKVVLNYREMFILTILMHHPGIPIGRRVFQACGFERGKKESDIQPSFSVNKDSLADKLAELKRGKPGLVRGPNEGRTYTYLLNGIQFVCGEGTEIIDTAVLLAGLQGTAQEPFPAVSRMVNSKPVVGNGAGNSSPVSPKTEPKPESRVVAAQPGPRLKPVAKLSNTKGAAIVSKYGSVNNAPSSSELLRAMRRRTSSTGKTAIWQPKAAD